MRSFYKNYSAYLIFGLVVIVAATLRFYSFNNIPYTHDEFSTIRRVNFENIRQLIDHGVKVDGHPAGVQMFLYYYTKWVGVKPWLVRLPFTVLGILSVILVVLIGRKLFSWEAGLFAGTIASVSQYFIFYSLVARPYSPGLFFTLASIYLVIKISELEKPKLGWYALFSLSLTLAAVMHYFSAFAAFLIYIFGFFLVQLQQRKHYLLAGVVSFLLFLPHLPITLVHLGVKGVGAWLPVPEWDFIIHHIFYPFHYRWLFFSVFVFAFFTSLRFYWKNPPRLKQYFLPLVWIVTYTTAYYYSRNVSSVMQTSVLLFSYAGLLIFLSPGILVIKKKVLRYTIVVFTLAAGTYTLVVDRQYYTVIENSVFDNSVRDFCSQVKSHNSHRALFASNQPRIPSMLGADSCAQRLIYVENFNLSELNHVLIHQEFDGVGVMIDNTLPGILAMVKEFYPHHVVARKFNRGEFHFFTREGSPYSNEWDTLYFQNYDTTYNSEFLDLAQWNLKHLPLKSWSEMDIVCKFAATDSSKSVRLVTELHYKNQKIDWREKLLSNNLWDNNHLLAVYHSLVFMDIHYPVDELYLKVYIWNPDRVNYRLKSCTITVRKANRMRYSLYYDIPRD